MQPSSKAPENRRSGGHRAAWLLVLAGLVAVLIVGFVAYRHWSGSGGGAAAPGPLVAALRGTDFRYAADPTTGYRRLSTPFAEDMSVDDAALGRDGTVAIAVHDAAGYGEIVVWRAGRFRDVSLGRGPAIEHLAVAPDGDVYAGLDDGSFERVPRTGHPVASADPIARGYSILAFAFDPASKRAATLLAGGEVRTALRPFTTRSLRPVQMPARARTRIMTFDDDGRLVVGGDGGEVFVATDDGWDDRSLPSHGRVVAFGHDLSGHVLVAQDDGNVYRVHGSSPERIGQVPSKVIAVGAMPGRGIVAVTDDGRVFATGDGDAFAPLPGRKVPVGMHVRAAAIAGHDVLVATTDRVQVLDDASHAVWDTATPAVRAPSGVAHIGCHPVGPLPAAVAVGGPIPPTLLSCDDGSFATLGAHGLTPVTKVSWGGATVPAGTLSHALDETAGSGALWLGGGPVGALPSSAGAGLRRWDPKSRAFSTLVSLDPAAGPVASMSGRATAAGLELFVAVRSGTVLHAVVTPGATSATPTAVATTADFQATFGPDFDPYQIGVYALGGGRALVMHENGDTSLLSRIDAASPHAATAVTLPAQDPDDFGLVDAGGDVLAVEDHHLWSIPQEGNLVPWALPPKTHLDVVSLGASFAATPAGPHGLLLVADRDDGSTMLLRCASQRCAEVPLPAGTRVRGAWLDSAGAVAVWESGDVIGVIEGHASSR